MKTSDKVMKYIEENGQVSAVDLVDFLGITDRAVRKQLRALLEKEKIVKSGKPPKVYYSIPQPKTQTAKIAGLIADTKTKMIIDDNFLYITPFGQKLVGWDGFVEWCADRKQDVAKMSKIYLKTIKKYNSHKKNGLIDGMSKLKSTFEDVALDKVFYIDFYSIEIFGKTKLGQLLLFAKQSQDRTLMNQMIDSIKPSVQEIIKRFNIDGIAYIPPTVKREHQLMKQIEKRLGLNTRKVATVKIKTPVIVPQKTLNKLEDRVINARETIIVADNGRYNNILLLDDAVGSGATLNETAKKIRQKGICRGKIIGLAITGSAKGFDVISEV